MSKPRTARGRAKAHGAVVRTVFLTSLTILAVAALLPAAAPGHEVPTRLPDPASAAEAWNVLAGSADNCDQLLEQNLLRDLTFQIVNADTSLRYLGSHFEQCKDARQAETLCRQLFADGGKIVETIHAAGAGTGGTAEQVRVQWKSYRRALEQLQSLYPPEVVGAAVYVCPMHPQERSLKSDGKCGLCGMPLVRRHLPASAIYQKPGEPTMKMTVTCPPLAAGRPLRATIRLVRPDGSPVLPSDLLEVHTRKIHLLINDASLGDYHHEHPAPTQVPGEYAFSFTPAGSGPYRLWADVVPAASDVQEYVIADIPAAADMATNAPKDPKDAKHPKAPDPPAAAVNGRRYALTLNDNKPVRAGQTVVGTVVVTNADGTPCTSLEPLMGAFAHLVAFHEDRRTVLHIHPYGPAPADANARAGPAFAFKFYAPAAGSYRLYCQTQVGGVSEFAPFAVAVQPAEPAGGEKE